MKLVTVGVAGVAIVAGAAGALVLLAGPLIDTAGAGGTGGSTDGATDPTTPGVGSPPAPIGTGGGKVAGFVTRAQWGAVGRLSGTRSIDLVDGWMLHHAASAYGASVNDHGTCAAAVRSLERDQMRRGYSTVAYHDVICPHGWVFVGRPHSFRGAHSDHPSTAHPGGADANVTDFGVCLLHNAAAFPIPKPMANAARGLYYLAQLERRRALAVHWHGEADSSACPGRYGIELARSMRA